MLGGDGFRRELEDNCTRECLGLERGGGGMQKGFREEWNLKIKTADEGCSR